MDTLIQFLVFIPHVNLNISYESQFCSRFLRLAFHFLRSLPGLSIFQGVI